MLITLLISEEMQRTTKWVIHGMSSLSISYIFLQEIQNQIIHRTPLRKWVKVRSVIPKKLFRLEKTGYSVLKKVAPTISFKVPQNWVICIESNVR